MESVDNNVNHVEASPFNEVEKSLHQMDSFIVQNNIWFIYIYMCSSRSEEPSYFSKVSIL